VGGEEHTDHTPSSANYHALWILSHSTRLNARIPHWKYMEKTTEDQIVYKIIYSEFFYGLKEAVNS